MNLAPSDDAHAAAAVPAGWFADPTESSLQRYWDGAAWTAHVAALQAEPAVVEPVVDTAPMWPAGWYLHEDGATRWWDGAAWSWPGVVTDEVPAEPAVVAEELEAGWYVDGQGSTRWWDGAAWTAHVAEAPTHDSHAAALAAGAAATIAAYGLVAAVDDGALPAVVTADVATTLPTPAAVPQVDSTRADSVYVVDDSGYAVDAVDGPAVAEPAVAPVAAPVQDWPAAWYPDQHSAGLLRWWDGAAWTRHAYLLEPGEAYPAPLPAAIPVAVPVPVAGAAAVAAPAAAAVVTAPSRAARRVAAEPVQRRGGSAITLLLVAALLAAAGGLFYMAWVSTRGVEAPVAPSISVVETPTPAATPTVEEPGTAAPTLSVFPLQP